MDQVSRSEDVQRILFSPSATRPSDRSLRNASLLTGRAITDDAGLLQSREFGVVQVKYFGEDIMVVFTEQRADAINRRIGAIDTHRQRGIRMPARVLVI